MARLIAILLIALTFEAIGVVFLSKGLKEITKPARVTPGAVGSMIRQGLNNPRLLTGVLFEALFFAGLLILMSKGEVSFVWPLTSLGFVFTTLAARIVLNEQVDALRWSGVVLIMLGVALISWSEKTRRDALPPGPAPALELK
jgi:drug/metabolite transporter (DMT)-like permease